jgi:6,7-dimethyl-8-ribityllumazine synthase
MEESKRMSTPRSARWSLCVSSPGSWPPLIEDSMNQHHDTTTPLRVAILAASWHRDLVDEAVGAFEADLASDGADHELRRIDVPGAFEIPLLAQKLAATGDYDAIVAFGLVVDGGIYRHDFVATAVIDGLMRVQLDSGVPVLSVVLTPHHFHETDTHRAWFADHLRTKGVEAAQSVRGTIEAHRAVGVPVLA